MFTLLRFICTDTWVCIWTVTCPRMSMLIMSALGSNSGFTYPVFSGRLVSNRRWLLCYCAVIESLFCPAVFVWFSNLTVKLQFQINRWVHNAFQVMWLGLRDYSSFQDIFEETLLRLAKKTIADPTHVWNSEFYHFMTSYVFCVTQQPVCSTEISLGTEKSNLDFQYFLYMGNLHIWLWR